MRNSELEELELGGMAGESVSVPVLKHGQQADQDECQDELPIVLSGQDKNEIFIVGFRVTNRKGTERIKAVSIRFDSASGCGEMQRFNVVGWWGDDSPFKKEAGATNPCIRDPLGWLLNYLARRYDN